MSENQTRKYVNSLDDDLTRIEASELILELIKVFGKDVLVNENKFDKRG